MTEKKTEKPPSAAPSREALKAALDVQTENDLKELRKTVAEQEEQLAAALIDNAFDALSGQYAISPDLLRALYRDRFQLEKTAGGRVRVICKTADGKVMRSKRPETYDDPITVEEAVETWVSARPDADALRSKEETGPVSYGAPQPPPKSETERQREALQARQEELKTRHGMHDDAEFVRIERELEELRIRDLQKRAGKGRKYTGEDLRRLRRELRETNDPLRTCQLESAIFDAECDLGYKRRPVAP